MSFEDKVMNYLAQIHQKMTGIENEVANVKRTVIHIENDHGQKLSALFDGYEQLSQGQEQLRQGQEQLRQGQEQLRQGQEQLSQRVDKLTLKVDQNTQAIKSLEERVTNQEIKLQLIK